jgi:hypothetical protein
MVHDHHPRWQRGIADRHRERLDRAAFARVDENPQPDRQHHGQDAQPDIATAQPPRGAHCEQIFEIAQPHRPSLFLLARG